MRKCRRTGIVSHQPVYGSLICQAGNVSKLLIVIPFKDQVQTTIQCLESIERQQHGLDLVVALVNNRSIHHETIPELRSWIAGCRYGEVQDSRP